MERTHYYCNCFVITPILIKAFSILFSKLIEIPLKTRTGNDGIIKDIS